VAKNRLHECETLVDCSTCFRVAELELAQKPVDNRRESDKFRALKTRIWDAEFKKKNSADGFFVLSKNKGQAVLGEFSGV
jgi:hypothetical protein